MNQIDREMWQAARAPGLFGAAVASPLQGALVGRGHEPWTARAWRMMRQAVDTILIWRERTRMRRHLLALDDRILKDIGISRSQAHGEAEKPFWRV